MTFTRDVSEKAQERQPGHAAAGREEPLRLQVLGRLRVRLGDRELDPGPRQQATLLAVLLARADQPTSQAELVELIWAGEPPATASNLIHKYVGALRRLLEPGLRTRDAGAHIKHRSDGYIFVTTGCELDLTQFREIARDARDALALGQDRIALDRMLSALQLWSGPVGRDSLGPSPSPIFTALNREFLDLCTAAAELAARLHSSERLLASLQLAAIIAPMDELIQAALVTSLSAAGQQTEALATLRRSVARLADEYAMDPGPALRAAQEAILSAQPANSPPTGSHPSHGATHVGRSYELDLVGGIVRSTLAGGSGVVMLDGEPGIGKTQFMREVRVRAGRWGVHVLWVTCIEGGGAPAMWPWVKMAEALLGELPPAEKSEWAEAGLGRLTGLATDPARPLSPPNGSEQFRLFEQFAGLVRRVAATSPLLMIIDDLHWADTASLSLFTHLTSELPSSAVVIAALRDRAPTVGDELSRVLATAGRLTDYSRIHLVPMDAAEVGELVQREIGIQPDAGVVQRIHSRTGGNPFFVRELSRLLRASETDPATALDVQGVPATVADVLRERTAALTKDVYQLLQIAAVIGRDSRLGVLSAAAGLEVSACAEKIEPLISLGLLEPAPGDPFAIRFPHDLVRESVLEVMPTQRARLLHLRVADALEAVGRRPESDSESLAFHLREAGPLADPARTVAALIGAGRSAAEKSALESAIERLQWASELAASSSNAELELAAVAALSTVLWRRADSSAAYTQLLRRGEQLARELGMEEEFADFLCMRVIVAISFHQPEADSLVRRLCDEGDSSGHPAAHGYAQHLRSIVAYEQGRANAALRYLDGDNWSPEADARWRQENPLRRERRILAPMSRALMLAVSDDIEAARDLFRMIEDAVSDDSYLIAVWAHWAFQAALLIGDVRWGRELTKRWREADPHHFFTKVDAYLRVSQCWTLALSGDDASAAAAEAERVITDMMLDPPMYLTSSYYTVLAEIYLAAGSPDQAETALDRADSFADAHDEHVAERFRLYMRVKVLKARGAADDSVEKVAASARELAQASGELILTRRLDEALVDN